MSMTDRFPRGWRATHYKGGFSVERALLLGFLFYWPYFHAYTLEEARRKAWEYRQDGQVVY